MGLVQGLRLLLHYQYWTLTKTLLRYPVVCPESWRYHGFGSAGQAPSLLKQLIDGIDVEVGQFKTIDLGLGNRVVGLLGPVSFPTPIWQPLRGRIRHPHDLMWLRWYPRPWISIWLLVETRASNSNTDPGCSRTMDPDTALSGSPDQDVTMALGGSIGYPDQLGFWQQPLDVNMVLVSSPDHGYLMDFSGNLDHRPQLHSFTQ